MDKSLGERKSDFKTTLKNQVDIVGDQRKGLRIKLKIRGKQIINNN